MAFTLLKALECTLLILTSCPLLILSNLYVTKLFLIWIPFFAVEMSIPLRLGLLIQILIPDPYETQSDPIRQF